MEENMVALRSAVAKIGARFAEQINYDNSFPFGLTSRGVDDDLNFLEINLIIRQCRHSSIPRQETVLDINADPLIFRWQLHANGYFRVMLKNSIK